jgi:hypothetical protein
LLWMELRLRDRIAKLLRGVFDMIEGHSKVH